MPRQTASERADLQGAAGVSAAEADAEILGQEPGPDDDEGQADDDYPGGETDPDVAELTGEPLRKPRPRRGPGHEDTTADWEGLFIPATIRPYLKPDEYRVIAMRRHVIRLAWPALVFGGGLVLAITLNAWAYSSGHAAPLTVHVIWWAWIMGAGWAVYKWLEWRQTWFVVTGFRLMLVETTRLLGRRIRMLPLDKLRDLEMNQTPLGRWQGFATFTFASIGTGSDDRALSEVDCLPEPEWLYQQINQLTMPTGTGRVMRRRTS